MSKKLYKVLIEHEGILYRGTSVDCPVEVWDYPRKMWVRYKDKGAKEPGWGRLLDEVAAERLTHDNPAAEHYRHYDIPPWSQPLSDAYKARTTSDHVKRLIANRQKNLLND